MKVPGFSDCLFNYWRPLTDGIGASLEKSCTVLDDLMARYNGPGRHYHNMDHVKHVLGTLKELSPDGVPPAVGFAAWFHDAIYLPGQEDNERRSAKHAREVLRYLGADESMIWEVNELVMATSQHLTIMGINLPVDPNVCLFLDADLAILGAHPQVYNQYAGNVRREFHFVPEHEFKEARTQVLKGFLERDRMYLTAEGHARFHVQARANMVQELDRLEQTIGKFIPT